MYSLSKGKIAIPSVWDVKKASIIGGDLIKQKSKLIGLYERLKVKQAEL